MTALKASPQLRKAAERELRLIAARRERLEERRARLDTELKAATDALAALKLRAELVDMLIDEPADAGSDSVAGTVLRGARIREVAMQLLYRRDGYGKVVHYRQWYDLLTGHGYVVLAKDPLASFLVNVGRSPFVTRGNQPGTYAVAKTAAPRRSTRSASRRLNAACTTNQHTIRVTRRGAPPSAWLSGSWRGASARLRSEVEAQT